MKISVIIPVYNGEKYLKRCLDSIINQSIGLNKLEIIIINDGSTDKSQEIICEYSQKYSQIISLDQENKGQGAARNQGLKEAKGEFISFVDCDDTIDSNMYKILLEEIEKNNLDIVTCDYNIITNNNNKIFSFYFDPDENKNFVIMNTGPCNMLLRHSFLKNKKFHFPENIIYEDFASIPSLGINSKIKHIKKPLYNYYKNSNSTMNQTMYNKKLEDIFKAFEILKAKIKSIYPEELEFLFIRNIMMSASLRFLEFNDPNKCIDKISEYAKSNYPEWKKNKYYKRLPYQKKIVAIFTYYKYKKILKVLLKIKRRVK